MEDKIKIIFGKSSSKHYENAINLANRFANFQPISRNNKYNTIIIPIKDLNYFYDYLQKLWQLISNWKDTEILLGKKKFQFGRLRDISEIVRCNKKYYAATNKDIHCKIDNVKEGWGCKHLNSVIRYLDNSIYSFVQVRTWYKYGYFESNHIWKIDKNRIFDILKEESEKKYLNYCEIFDLRRVQKLVNTLPDEINLEKSKEWKIEYIEYTDGITLEKKPVSILKKTKADRNKHNLGIRHFGNLHLDNRPSEVGISINFENEKEKSDSNKKRFIPDTKFKEIGGIDEIVETIREVIELPIKNPGMFKHLGIKPHKAILLYGAPGCGKTLIAKAIANEINAHFIPIKGPELFSKYHGESEENLRNIFNEAVR